MNRRDALLTVRDARILAHATSRDIDQRLARIEAYLMPDRCEIDGYRDEVICGNCQSCEKGRFEWELEWGDNEPNNW